MAVRHLATAERTCKRDELLTATEALLTPSLPSAEGRLTGANAIDPKVGKVIDR